MSDIKPLTEIDIDILVQSVATMCKEKLMATAHKGHWDSTYPNWPLLVERLDEESSELNHELFRLKWDGIHGKTYDEADILRCIRAEAVDVINIAMFMIARATKELAELEVPSYE